MRRAWCRTIAISACTVCSITAFADKDGTIKALKDEQEIFSAQQARDKAEADAIKAANDLAAAKADAANNGSTIEAKTLTNETTLTKAKIANELATASALKDALGTPPDVGNKGTVAFEDGKSAPTFLPVERGSLQLTWEYASKLCTVLKPVGPVYFVKADFDSKFFAAKDKLMRFKSVYEDYVNNPARPDDASMAKANIAVAPVVVAAVSIQYLAGALQSVANLFKNDTKVVFGNGKDRSIWLGYFMAYKCPETLPVVDLGVSANYDGVAEAFLKKVQDLARFNDYVSARKGQLTKSIEDTKKEIDELNKKKKPHKALDESLNQDQTLLTQLKDADFLVTRIKGIVDDVQTKPEDWYAALVMDKAMGDVVKGNRINVDYVTQDGQLTKTNWLLGTRVFGVSSGELIYRVTNSQGRVLLAGYLVGNSAVGKLNLDTEVENEIDGPGVMAPVTSSGK